MKNIVKRKYLLTLKLSSIFVISVFLFGVSFYISGSFEGHDISLDDKGAGFWDCIYFSVVSITTLGYGDFTPEGASRIIASFEAVFGLVFVGYSLSQILSLKQEAIIEYIANDAIFQTYTDRIDKLADAKELIGDKRRQVIHNIHFEDAVFIYNRGNPFYPALKALQTINGYTAHLDDIDKATLLGKHIERASHHLEELISFIRKLLLLMDNKSMSWRTDRTKKILTEICDAAEYFNEEYIPYTKYFNEEYKNSGLYTDKLTSLISDVRSTYSK